jgi:hypothetical protein
MGRLLTFSGALTAGSGPKGGEGQQPATSGNSRGRRLIKTVEFPDTPRLSSAKGSKRP